MAPITRTRPSPQQVAYMQARKSGPNPFAGLPAEAVRRLNQLNIDEQIAFLTYIGRRPNHAIMDALVRDWAETHYGALAAYLDHHEIGPLLLKAAREGWTPERLQQELGQTDFWQHTTATQREFDLLVAGDPATANQKISAMTKALYNTVVSEGVGRSFPMAKITKLARTLLRNGVTPEDTASLTRTVAAEARYNPTHPQLGRLGATITAVKAAADQYLVPISDQAAFKWAQQIETGQQTPEGLAASFRNQVRGQFSEDVIKRVDQGQTVRQILDPQIQRTAELLERDPSSIDFRDPRFRPIIQFNDGNGVRERTLAETEQYVRSQIPDYRYTTRANQEASSLIETVLSRFGKVA